MNEATRLGYVLMNDGEDFFHTAPPADALNLQRPAPDDALVLLPREIAA